MSPLFLIIPNEKTPSHAFGDGDGAKYFEKT